MANLDDAVPHEVTPGVSERPSIQDQLIQVVELLSGRLITETEALNAFHDKFLHPFVGQDKLV